MYLNLFTSIGMYRKNGMYCYVSSCICTYLYVFLCVYLYWMSVSVSIGKKGYVLYVLVGICLYVSVSVSTDL